MSVTTVGSNLRREKMMPTFLVARIFGDNSLSKERPNWNKKVKPFSKKLSKYLHVVRPVVLLKIKLEQMLKRKNVDTKAYKPFLAICFWKNIVVLQMFGNFWQFAEEKVM